MTPCSARVYDAVSPLTTVTHCYVPVCSCVPVGGAESAGRENGGPKKINTEKAGLANEGPNRVLSASIHL